MSKLTDLSVGIQLYSVRKALANDFFGTLEKIVEIGYRNIEMYFESPYFARFDVPCPSGTLTGQQTLTWTFVDLPRVE